MVYTLILTGETPSKKNSRINTRSGRSFPSQKYTQWHSIAVLEIKKAIAKRKIKPIPKGKQVFLTITFYHGDKRKRDSDNQLTSILDTLVDAGVLLDDNWRIIPHKEIFDAYDKDNARAIISIELLP